MKDLLDQYPHVNNLQTRTQALGLAVLDGAVYYLSTAGPGTACKSVWSSLVSPRATFDCVPWGVDLMGAANLQTAYQSLPNSNFQHMVTLAKQSNLLLCIDSQAAPLHDELEIEHVQARQGLLAEQMPEIIERFVAYLNAETDVPVIEDWGETLWETGLYKGGIQSLATYGDCLAAWLVDESFDWLAVVQRLLRVGDIHFPQQQNDSELWLSAADIQQVPLFPAMAA